MMGSKALKLARERGYKPKPIKIKQKFRSFILHTDEDIEKLQEFRDDPINDGVKAHIVNLTGKSLSQASEDERLKVICEICNKSCGYERYVVRDGKVVEASSAGRTISKKREKEPFPHVQSAAVLGEEYMKKWRLRPDGTPKSIRELREQW